MFGYTSLVPAATFAPAESLSNLTSGFAGRLVLVVLTLVIAVEFVVLLWVLYHFWFDK